MLEKYSVQNFTLQFQESIGGRRVWLKENTDVNLIVFIHSGGMNITTPNRAPLNKRNKSQIYTIILLPV